MEHVPPKKAGGIPLVLTCKNPCNDRSGHELDSHIAASVHFRNVFAGEAYARAKVTQFSLTLNADIRLGSEPEIRVSEGNDQRLVDAHYREFQRTIAEGGIPSPIDIELTFRHTAWREQIAWLRVGYLLAFASLGYNFVLREVLNPVRNQIARPAEQLIPSLVRKMTPPTVPPSILFPRMPEHFKNIILVSIAERLILLPRHHNDAKFFDRMAALRPTAGGVTITGFWLELPRSPEFRMDLDDKETAGRSTQG